MLPTGAAGKVAMGRNKEEWLWSHSDLGLGYTFHLWNLGQVAPLLSLSFPNCKMEIIRCPHQAVCGAEMG